MIDPVICESAWLDYLSRLQPLKDISGRALVIVPHPDDETLAAGGLIWSLRKQGISVKVIAVTDGESAYQDEENLGTRRVDEQNKALARLGVDAAQIVRLGLPDSDVSSCERELEKKLLPYISSNTHVIAPWCGDFHPDHEVCGRIAESLTSEANGKLISYLFWTWHRGTLDTLDKDRLRYFSLSVAAAHAKAEALQCHASQLWRPYGDEILPALLLKPAQRPFEVFIDS